VPQAHSRAIRPVREDLVSNAFVSVGSPWPRRVGAWLVERFPPGPYTVLVALFWGSAVLVVRRLCGAGDLVPTAGLVVLLAFLHLRILDEYKDYAVDRRSYPNRVLSRGIVTLGLLGRVLLVVITLEAILAFALGTRAFVAWVVAFAFSVAMRFEFGVGDRLRDSLVVYAVTHNPIVALLAVFVWAATGAPWDGRLGWFLAMVSFGSLGFELGRKIRLPHEEHAGVDSYTTDLGQSLARALLILVHVATAGSLIGLVTAFGRPDLAMVGLPTVIVGVVTAAGLHRAKVVEAGATGALLLGLLSAGLVAWST
jgi:hypothetical protein